MNRDYIFHINWADRYKNPYRVGILAEIDECFYCIVKGEIKAETAYKKGFAGIPGFREEEVYKSSELFDFFKSRILDREKSNPSEALAKSKGISMIDSFSVEEVPERTIHKYKELVLKAYELQERKKEMQEENKVQVVKSDNKEVDSNILGDIE